MKNIVLTGFMGTGKTAVGRKLSRLLNMELIDVDTEIEKSQKMTINDMFKKFGEPRFREIETEMIKKLLNFRKPFYDKADIPIDTEAKTPIQIAEEIIEKIKVKVKN